MSDPALRLATYADLQAVPAHLVAELVGGVLHTHPRPAPPHARAASRLTSRLGRAFDEGDDGPGGWWIIAEPELHLIDDQVAVPDLAGWRLARMPELPEAPYFPVAPDWICEVLSPSTEAYDRADKMPLYAAAAVGHAWLLDPLVKTLEVFHLESGHWVLDGTIAGERPFRAEPFAAIELQLSALWRPPTPERTSGG